jgi:hypothetical protein
MTKLFRQVSAALILVSLIAAPSVVLARASGVETPLQSVVDAEAKSAKPSRDFLPRRNTAGGGDTLSSLWRVRQGGNNP